MFYSYNPKNYGDSAILQQINFNLPVSYEVARVGEPWLNKLEEAHVALEEIQRRIRRKQGCTLCDHTQHYQSKNISTLIYIIILLTNLLGRYKKSIAKMPTNFD